MASRKLIVEIAGDPSSLERAFKKAGNDTQAFGRGFGKVAKGVGIAAAGVAGGIAFGLKKSIDSANAHAEALAQTQAVLKSTGGAANVTAKQITGLADSIEKSTGFDDLAIEAGENLLATFTNIRNEAGKGNDIFTQTTRTLADMSVALGEDTKSSAIQLGKALNDPVRGITALQRVGVSFTKGQKDQIKALVDSGKTLDAQKLILRELNKEFGGSAEAAGRTLPGQLNILKARLDDVAQRIGEKLVPALTNIVDWVSDHWPEISRVIKETFAAVERAWVAVQPVFKVIFQSARQAVEYIRQNWPAISRVVGKVAEDIRIIWAKVGPTLTKVFKIAVATIGPLLQSIARILQGVARIIDGIIHGRWSEVWQGLKDVIAGVFTGIKTLLIAEAKIILTYGEAIGKALLKGIVSGLKGLGRLLLRLLIAPINAVIDAINQIKIGPVKVFGKTITPGIDPIPDIPRIPVPGGAGGTQTTIVHTQVNVDGQEIAKAVTTHQQRSSNRTAPQRRGRRGGTVHGIH